MKNFNLQESLRRAEKRFKLEDARPRKRKTRSDRGGSRLHPDVERKTVELLSGWTRPNMAEVGQKLQAHCVERGLRAPSRATLYNIMARANLPPMRVDGLPKSVRQTLYNLGEIQYVGPTQLAFYCFNYGTLPAMSFAAGLPWLALHQARKMRGWRPKSLGPLVAVLQVR